MDEKRKINAFTSFFFKNNANETQTLKPQALLAALGVVVFLTLLFYFFKGLSQHEKSKFVDSSIEEARNSAPVTDSAAFEQAQGAYSPGSQSPPADGLAAYFSDLSSLGSGGKASSSMIIERHDEVKDVTTTLPRGTLLVARLLNTIVSNNTKSPVVANVLLDCFQLNQLLIPKDTKLIGQATQDNNPRRVTVTFDTMVFPSKQQISFSAIALNPDGSSGLTGQYYSGKGKEIFGALMASAIAGAAQGGKTVSLTPFGTEIKRGSVKDAVLGGVSEAALDQAKRFAEEIKTAQGFVIVPQEAQILVFFDQSLNLGEITDEY